MPGQRCIAYPHETTADQWYAESQFESYRALGEHTVKSLGRADYREEASGGSIPEGPNRLSRMFDDIADADGTRPKSGEVVSILS